MYALRNSVCCSLTLCAAAALSATEPAPLPTGYKLLYEQACATPDSLKDFVALDPAVWKHGTSPKGGFLELAYTPKKYKAPKAPKHRSPYHMAMIAGRQFTDFVMDLEMQSTITPYPHQDLCLFFGYQSPKTFYYTHLAVRMDPHAHNVFIVQDAPRVKISTETTPGITWKENHWHKVRLVREGTTGKVEVYFDDMSKPVMRATDRSFPTGWVGVGSFDDIGRYRNIKVYSPSATDKRLSFLKPLETK